MTRPLPGAVSGARPWEMPWGVVPATAGGTNGRGWAKHVGLESNTVAAILASLTIAFVVVPGRLYEFTVGGPVLGNTNATVDEITFNWHASSFTYPSGATPFAQFNVSCNNTGAPMVASFCECDTGSGGNLPAGQKFVMVVALAGAGTWNTGNGSTGAPNFFYIKDIGPA